MDTVQIVLIVLALAGLYLLFTIAARLADIAGILGKQLKALNENMNSMQLNPPHEQNILPPAQVGEPLSESGSCFLTGVDEETAAVIIAIITEQHPGEELKFISIKAL